MNQQRDVKPSEGTVRVKSRTSDVTQEVRGEENVMRRMGIMSAMRRADL